jgi:hypothetical protein
MTFLSGRTILKMLSSVLLGFLSIPMLGSGGYLLVCWFRIHTSNVYYVDYPYVTTALACLGIGLISLWATLYGVWRRSFYGILFVIPILELVATHIILEPSPHVVSLAADTQYLSYVHSSVRVWYENNHRFPASEAEFSEGLRAAPMSQYKQRGNPLQYEFVVMTDANGPKVASVSQRPGTIYYCVSKNLQEFWVTMTRLQSDVAPTAYLQPVANLPEEFWLIHEACRDYPVRKP